MNTLPSARLTAKPGRLNLPSNLKIAPPLRKEGQPLDGRRQLPLLRLVKRITGFDVTLYRQSTLSRRLELRLHATGCETIEDYLRFIKKNPREAFAFQEHLLIHVTRFFRDKPVFTYLERRILPNLLDDLLSRQRRTVRVWSLGCATGQEAYSLAMVLYNLTRQRGIHPVILASDASARVLAQAREACFQEAELKSVPRPWRELYFYPEKKGGFRIVPKLRNMVIFRQHNLISDEPPGTFDLIMCRNLLIFFKPEAHDFLLTKISQALNETGILVLGRSESINANPGLKLVSSRYHVYQKTEISRPFSLSFRAG